MVCVSILMKKYVPTIFIALLSLFGSNAFSQHEYLATVDPATGTYVKLDSIPGVRYVLLFQLTTLDKNDHRVIFAGGPSQTEFSLLTLNASNGQILSHARLPGYSNLITLSYSSGDGLLYGITVESGVYAFVTINLETANYSVISSLPIDEVSEMVADDLHKCMYVNGLFNGTPQLLTVNMLNGNVINRVASGVSNLVYDNSKGKLYGIGPGNFFGNLDPATGIFTQIKRLPAEVVGITQGNTTFDEKDQLYIFTGSDNEGQSFLYSIDATTGQMIYKAVVSLANEIDKENLIQYRFDNSSQILYALHWKPKLNAAAADSSCSLNMKIHLYPDPFGDILMINKAPAKCTVNLNLFNSLGQLLITGKMINDGENKIKLSYLPDGVYYYEFYSNRRRLLTGKVVKIR